MVYDIHDRTPQLFRQWLEESGPAIGAEILATDRGPRVRFNGGFTSGPLRHIHGHSNARIAAMNRNRGERQIPARAVKVLERFEQAS